MGQESHIQFDLIDISSIFSMCMFLLLFLSLFGNGATGLWTWSVIVSLSNVCGADWDEWLYTFIALFFNTFSYLSCNKSTKFLVLNVYFAEDNHGKKEDKNKYQLNSDLTRSIWLEEDDPKFSCFWWIGWLKLKINRR